MESVKSLKALVLIIITLQNALQINIPHLIVDPLGD